jgi:uracil-DNA glycosylase
MDVKINNTWKPILQQEFDKPYFINLVRYLHEEKQKGNKIFPPGNLIFNAFDLTPFDKVNVVIIGQDPYHGPGQAEGLSFSVPIGISIPPSLKNIYKEIYSDTGKESITNGSLRSWAEQGVFLLNAILTVRASEAASHSEIGWKIFTDAVIKAISDRREGVVFLLWGNYARGKKELIDSKKHFILEAPHPSPLARGGFFGCKHFSKTNEILHNLGRKEIIW